MLAQERQEIILQTIKDQKSVKTSQLMERFKVSNETIRRDLDYLEQQGSLKKVYGGAIYNKKLGWEPPLFERTVIKREEKQAIARESAKLVNDGDFLFVDLGTTPLEVVKNLNGKKDLTIFTTSLPVANYVTDELGANCIIIGGEVCKKERCLKGPITEMILDTLHFDKAFLSAGGIDEKYGLTDYDLNNVSVKRKVVECTDEVIVVSDSSKFGVRALSKVAALGKLSIIVTDDNITEDYATLLPKCGISLITAPKEIGR